MSNVQVSVCILTYNHEKYIEECINSIINQETTFSFEIIVSDDCSSDGTWEILLKYKEKYPDLIKIHRNEENIGGCSNYNILIEMAECKYIAYLDGDDYAYQGKLQVQYNILEENPQCNVVLHAVDSVSYTHLTLPTSDLV